ncbi:MAG: InlB B-repeat-containing protein [Bifidobacterium sp.]|nr:InlB B-repeat-containing protein [Bifidobacterium sp.]
MQFDTHGGGTVATQTMGVNGVAVKPEDPVREGYQFVQWTTDAAGQQPYTFGTTVSEPLVLHAQWLPVRTITFDANGGDGPIDPKQVVQGAWTQIDRTATRAGHEFRGWSSQVEGGTLIQPGSWYEVQSDTTLYAQWERQSVSVAFNPNGGTFPMGMWNGQWMTSSGDARTVSVLYGDAVPAPDDAQPPTLNGKVFVGWTVEGNANAPYDFTSPVEGNLTLVAKWADPDKPLHVVTLDHHDGTNGASDNKVSQFYAEEGSTVSLPDVTRDNHRFLGWATTENGDPLAGGGTGHTSYSVGNEDVTLHAQWVRTWTVRFDAAGGSAVESRTVDHGSSLLDAGASTAALTPARDGYDFKGWKLEDGTAYDLASPVTADLRLVASWEKAGKRWVVRFHLNGGAASDAGAAKLEPQTVIDGEYAKQPELADGELIRAGYTFQGWSTVRNDAFAKSIFPFDTQPIDRNATLYAMWSKSKS